MLRLLHSLLRAMVEVCGEALAAIWQGLGAVLWTGKDMKLWKGKLLLVVSGLIWIVVIGVGMGILWRYEHTPGLAAAPPGLWPKESSLLPDKSHATIVMLVHPQCPCTRASIGELAILMTQCQGLVDAYVLFIQPAGFSDQWTQTDLWQSAAAIPNVIVRRDPGGIEARRFQAETSGQVLLYGVNGELLFHGGITGSRGHFGDNDGRSKIISLLTEGISKPAEALVFGCSLFDQQCAHSGEAAQ